jgi:ferredoxin
VYGNVGVGVTLQQLASLAQARGFSVIGGASFVGEHSFSHAALPVAAGRPNEGDLQGAEAFGQQVVTKLAQKGNHTNNHKIAFPSKIPLMARLLPKNSAPLFTHPPHVDLSVCVHCGACAKACPMGAIDEKTLEIDQGQCVRCFACVRRCPTSARQITLKRPWLVRWGLKKAIVERQEPQFYL